MVVLETRQTEDQSGLSNLYVLEIAENYVMLPWPSYLLALGIMGNSQLHFSMNASSQDFHLSSLTLSSTDASLLQCCIF